MKSRLLIPCLLFFLLPTIADAANGDNCAIDITTGVSNDTDWSQVYIIRGADGSAWQRAPINNQTEIKLNEREQTPISGIAQFGSDVQVFIFSPEDNGSGGMKKPGDGTCFDAGQTNLNGQFTLNFNAKLLWGSLGKGIIVDAFYKMDQDWSKVPNAVESQNFLIGTHSFPKELQINAAGDPKQCPLLCDKSKVVEGVTLDPATLDQKLLGNNFDALGGQKTIVARMPGEHTFYAGTVSGNNSAKQTQLSDLSLKVLTMERLKRMLLGDPHAGNFPPGLTNLTSEALRDAANFNGNASTTIKQLAGQIRTIMTDTPYTGEMNLGKFGTARPVITPKTGDTALINRTIKIDLPTSTPAIGLLAVPNAPQFAPSGVIDPNEATNYPQTVQDLGGDPPTGSTRSGDGSGANQPSTGGVNQPSSGNGGGGGSGGSKPQGGGSPKKNDGGSTEVALPPPPPPPGREEVLKNLGPFLAPAGPPQLPGELFPTVTSSVDTWAEDFVKLMEFWTGSVDINECLALKDAQFEPSFKKENFKVDADYLCSYVYTRGLTPTILLNTDKPVTLEPDFQNASIVSADKRFDVKHGWLLPEGKKAPISYRYEFSTGFTGDQIANFCVQPTDIEALVGSISSEYRLLPEEASVLAQELQNEIGGTAGYYRVSLADPQAISKRFIWKGNGQKLDVLQLFFEIKANSCSKIVTAFPSPVANTPSRDGFEAGILQ